MFLVQGYAISAGNSTNNMSDISNNEGRKIPAWKVSDSSRIYNNDSSATQNSFQLPDRFTPSKSGKVNAFSIGKSKEKAKVISRKTSGEGQYHSRANKQKLQGSSSDRKLVWKQTKPANTAYQTTRQESNDPKVLQQLGEASVSPKRTVKSGKFQSQSRLMVGQIKEEFSKLKGQVRNELASQREVICRISDAIVRHLSRIQAVHQANQEQNNLRREEQNIFNIMDDHMHQFQEQVGPEPFHINSKGRDYAQSNHHQNLNESDVEKYQQRRQAKKSPNRKEVPDLIIQVPVPSSLQQGQRLLKLQKMNQNLQKCNRIVETVSILSQINSSPVRTKPLERTIAQQHKKIAAAAKDSIQSSSSPKQHKKDSGNFKIDQFYSTIQRLREEVNGSSPTEPKQAVKDRAVNPIF